LRKNLPKNYIILFDARQSSFRSARRFNNIGLVLSTPCHRMVLKGRGIEFMSKYSVAIALLFVSGVAAASMPESFREPTRPPKWNQPPPPPRHDVQAPEIDPASTVSAMSLLLGSLVVLRGGKSAR
jgi:hypothetical protein